MKTLSSSIKIIVFLLAFFSAISCSSLPYSSESFLEKEGAPLYLQDRSPVENINGLFPETVYIKTLTQTFSFDYEFQLFNGRVYYKKRDGSKLDWVPLLETGLPPSVNRVVEIAADADVLYCFSDEGKLYRCYTKKITSYTPFEWVDYFGWPIKMPLYQNEVLKNKKGWAVGSSRKDVEYYEDIYGNEHNYGPLGVESIPFLCEDGQTIHYSDPACPSDFSHSFRTPDNVVLENISESASTIFVISKDGRMYTRLVDFNTVGSDPMLYAYTYVEKHSDLPGSDKRSNTTEWALPNEPWKQQPPLPEGSQSTIYITIIQNGKGNDARELRVAAVSPEGETGYYYKNIVEDEWQFMPANFDFDTTAFCSEVEVTPVDNLQKYYGGLWKNGEKISDINCYVEDFHFSEGPCTLVINNDLKIQLYYSEVWTLFLRLNPGYIESPISYFGTCIFDEQQLESFNGNLEIKKIFTGRNRVLHEFNIEVFDSYMKISLDLPKEDTQYVFYMTKNGDVFVNPNVDKKIIQKTALIDQRLENQRKYYEDEKDLLKDERKINKNKRKISKRFYSVINGKKGKKHPVIKFSVPKVAIILQYSGEICKVNNEYYKEYYKLYKKYSKYIKYYNKVLENCPDFSATEVFMDYLSENLDGETFQNMIYIDSIPYFPAFLVQEDEKLKIYTPKKGSLGVYKYYSGDKSKIKLKKKTFR